MDLGFINLSELAYSPPGRGALLLAGLLATLQIAAGAFVLGLTIGVFGALFSAFTIGLVFAAFGVGGVIYMYSRDLPDHETLARYNPATLSRIYSGEGEIMDEFARPGEVRIYVPAEEIPDVVMQAVISAWASATSPQPFVTTWLPPSSSL